MNPKGLDSTAQSFGRAILAAKSVDGAKRRVDRVRILRAILKLAEWSLRRLSFRQELVVSGGVVSFEQTVSV